MSSVYTDSSSSSTQGRYATYDLPLEESKSLKASVREMSSDYTPGALHNEAAMEKLLLHQLSSDSTASAGAAVTAPVITCGLAFNRSLAV